MSPITRSKKRKIEAEIQPNSSKKQKHQSSFMNNLMKNPGFTNITEKILLHLVHKDLQSCRLVCHSWKMQVDQPHFWIKKCNQRGQPGDLFNAWFDLVRRIEKGSFLENELVKCIMTWHGVIHTYAKEELDGINPVHIATRCGFKDIVKFIASFVDNNVNAPKGNGVTPMFVAARFGHLNIVKFLGEKIENSYATEVEGWTPIMLAASNGHNELVRYLAKKVENPNEFTSDGWSAIHLASQEGHIEIVNYLGSMVDNPNAPNQNGLTPIHLAARYGQTEVIQSPIFKSNPRNYTQPLPNGQTPINLAARNNHSETVRMILKIISDMCQTFPDEMMNALT